jgi:hypothetical protein
MPENEKFRKLQNYVAYLGEKGAEDEKTGELVSAIATYLKLVDVLLVMADISPNYPLWVKCTSSAENYQKRIKLLIPKASLKEEEEKEKALTLNPIAAAVQNTDSQPK